MLNGKELLIHGLEELGISFSEKQINQFLLYYELLIEKNKVMNLTAITEFNEVIVKHFIDSLLVVKDFDLEKVETMIDVGTGAGFPGIPMKIMFPHMKIVLLDSLKKRLNFLDEVISELGLEDITTVHSRAEDIAKNKEYRERFDLCVSRAVANLSTLSEYCIPFVKKSGIFISYKSSTSDEEVKTAKKAISVLGGTIISKNTIELPCSDMERVFVNIEKVNETPKKFPRKAGLPSKEPIQ
ncbi:MAG: 16S rRNA (guanine(527)-N(7))-methyltransferase RsmG [Eubacterium sp.]|nr:16S rRNA (guanine(527)-N(7))-methyltransferase RsmG [Eubacterium sp.]